MADAGLKITDPGVREAMTQAAAALPVMALAVREGRALAPTVDVYDLSVQAGWPLKTARVVGHEAESFIVRADGQDLRLAEEKVADWSYLTLEADGGFAAHGQFTRRVRGGADLRLAGGRMATAAPPPTEAEIATATEKLAAAPATTVYVDADDDAMIAAVAEARRAIPAFVELCAKAAEGSVVGVKTFVVGRHKWVRVLGFRENGDAFGVFEETGPDLPGFRQGDKLTAPRASWTDWAIFAPPADAGPIYGGFTLREFARRHPEDPAARRYVGRFEATPPTSLH